jgi:hypothetical protein
MKDCERLTDKQAQYVRHLASGKPSRDAAKAAGYSDSYARVATHRLMKKPTVAQAIERIRVEGMKMAAYGVVEAMKEADDAAAFARANKNSMALVKACELRAKLSGLLIDRIETVTVDLTSALARAEARVFNVATGASSPAALLPLPAKGATRWSPRLPGDPEAGSANGQGGNAA